MLRQEDRPLDVGLVAAVIASGGSLSPAVNLQGLHLCGIRMPAGWDAADITFQVSYDDGATFRDLYDVSGEVSIPVAANRHVVLELARFVGIGGWIKVRSGTAGAPVNQTANRSVELVTRAL